MAKSNDSTHVRLSDNQKSTIHILIVKLLIMFIVSYTKCGTSGHFKIYIRLLWQLFNRFCLFLSPLVCMCMHQHGNTQLHIASTVMRWLSSLFNVNTLSAVLTHNLMHYWKTEGEVHLERQAIFSNVGLSIHHTRIVLEGVMPHYYHETAEYNHRRGFALFVSGIHHISHVDTFYLSIREQPNLSFCSQHNSSTHPIIVIAYRECHHHSHADVRGRV